MNATQAAAIAGIRQPNHSECKARLSVCALQLLGTTKHVALQVPAASKYLTAA